MFKNEKTTTMGAIIVWTALYGMILLGYLCGYEENLNTLLIVSIIPVMYFSGRFLVFPLFTLGRCKTETSLVSMNVAMIMAGTLLFLSIATGYLGDAGLLPGDIDTSKRHVSGVFMGLMFILIGNYMPKVVEPITKAACDPATHQRFQRQSGWIFVITGLVYTASWFVFERETANTISTTAVVICILLVAPRLAWYGMKLRQRHQNQSPSQ